MKRIDVKGAIIADDIAWIYDYFGVSYCSPNVIHNAIAEANGDRLDVYINSGGGDVFAGSEIYAALREYGGDVKIHVVGLAASAASVIACAAKSEISPTGMLMVHNVSSMAEGDYHAMDKSSEVLQKANEAIASAYVAKTGMSMAEALALMDRETWLSANDAVEKGLIDEVSEGKNYQLVASASGMIPTEIINKMMAEKAEKHERQKTQANLKLMQLKGRI